MSDFYKYFKENMEGLGLPAPAGLFGTFDAAVKSAAVILSQVDKFGKRVTIGEIAGAGTRLEALGVIAACSAAFYVGAVIGSLAVALGRSLSGGTSIADVLYIANTNQLIRPWLLPSLHLWPGIYSPAVAQRDHYRFHAVVA